MVRDQDICAPGSLSLDQGCQGWNVVVRHCTRRIPGLVEIMGCGLVPRERNRPGAGAGADDTGGMAEAFARRPRDFRGRVLSGTGARNDASPAKTETVRRPTWL